MSTSTTAASYDDDDDRLFVQAAKKLLQPENQVIKLQYEEDDNVNLIHQSAQIEKDQNVLFGFDSIHSDRVDRKSDQNKSNQFRPSDDDDDDDDDDDTFLASSLSISLCDDDESEDAAEEDYLIEIPLPEPTVSSEDHKKRHKLKTELSELVPDQYPVSQSQQQGGLEDFLSDINEMSGEENLIEIDISMGSIRQSSGCEITT